MKFLNYFLYKYEESRKSLGKKSLIPKNENTFYTFKSEAILRIVESPFETQTAGAYFYNILKIFKEKNNKNLMFTKAINSFKY